jgi:hypothetical protein
MRPGIVLLGVVLFMGVTGCSQKADNTPKDALVKAGNALLNGDKDAYLANVRIPQGSQADTEAMLDARKATRSLIEAVRKALGDKVAKDFEGQDQPAMAVAAAQVDKLTFDEEGTVAVATTPDKKEFRFIMDGKHWKVDLSQSKPPSPEATKREKATAQAFRKITPQVGKPGFETKEIIDKALMAEIQKAMGS